MPSADTEQQGGRSPPHVCPVSWHGGGDGGVNGGGSGGVDGGVDGGGDGGVDGGGEGGGLGLDEAPLNGSARTL